MISAHCIVCNRPFEKTVHNRQRCDEHLATYAKDYRAKPEVKERRNEAWRRRYAAVGYEEHVAQHYKLSPERLAVMSERGCWTCGLSDNLCVDHDHSCCPSNRNTCGRCIRGVLCVTCNAAIGSAKNNPNLLRALADYLEGRSE